MNIEQILRKIDQMAPAALSELVCTALDDAGVEYVRGRSDITFSGLSADDNTYRFSLQFDICPTIELAHEKLYEVPVTSWEQYSYQAGLNSYSNSKAVVAA